MIRIATAHSSPGDFAVGLTITERLEAIKKLTPKGIEYWKARELMSLLGYARWENFQNAIQRSITAFVVAEEKPENHFRETRTMVEIGSGAEKEATVLPKPGCLLHHRHEWRHVKTRDCGSSEVLCDTGATNGKAGTPNNGSKACCSPRSRS
jgi:hypothetical protein